MATRSRRSTVTKRHRKGLKLPVALAAAGLLGAGGLAAVPADAVTATVLNHFQQNCSRWTGHCGAYYQVNPPYNSSVGSYYTQSWSWTRF